MNKKFLLFLVLLISIVSVSCVSASDMTADYASDLSLGDESLDLETSFESSSSQMMEESVDDGIDLGLDDSSVESYGSFEDCDDDLSVEAYGSFEDCEDDLSVEDGFSGLDESDDESDEMPTSDMESNDCGKSSTQIIVSDETTYNNDYENVLVTLVDSEGKPLSGLPVSVDLYGETTYVTDDNGQIKVSKMGLGEGVHIARIIFIGNDKYDLSVGIAAIRSTKLSTFFEVSDMTSIWKNDDYLVITLKDNKDNLLSGMPVSVDLNGESTYFTDKNGQVKIPTKGLDLGNYTAQIRFEGNGEYAETYETAKVSINKEDVMCDAWELDGLNLYISVMDTYGTSSAESVREYVSTCFQTSIPKDHSNTLRLMHDIRSISDKLIISITGGNDIVIDGQGHTIDLAGSASHDHYFVIKSGHVTFKNINFINGYNKDGDKGGALSFEDNAFGTIMGCTFKNCWAENHGGAIADRTGNRLTVINSTFIGNKASEDNGGAIFAKGELYIEGCLFDSNKACVDGGAIFCDNDVIVKRSVFNSNKASGAKIHQCYGGAIRSKKTAYIDNCTFFNNTSEDYGGAVYAKNIHVNQEQSGMSHFYNNSAKDNDGGALYADDTVKASYANFYYNRAYEDGGAIFSDNDVYIDNCDFTYNDADGAKISDCEGGAIFAEDNVHLYENIKFNGNVAKDHAGAIDCDDVYFYAPSVDFCCNRGNHVPSLDMEGVEYKGIAFFKNDAVTGSIHFEF